MDRVTINTSHPKLQIPRLFDEPQKIAKTLSSVETKQDQLRFTTESSMENNYDSAYQKLNPRNVNKQRPAPTTENWIG
jgi:hypothetical protein